MVYTFILLFFFLPEYLAATAATVCALHKIMNNCTEAKWILFSMDNQHQQQGAQHPGCNCAIETVSRPGAAVPIAKLGGKKKKKSLPAYNTTQLLKYNSERERKLFIPGRLSPYQG